MKPTILAKGAEATIFRVKEKVVKDRIPKSYRLPELDLKLRKRRTKKEAKLLEKASKIIPTPKIIETDEKEKIILQYIEGKKLSEHLDSLKDKLKICKQIGKQIATLHDNDIIHGDLTTSNMIYSNNNRTPSQKIGVQVSQGTIFFIDLGLGFISSRIEDKAVDLHLIKQALEAKHHKNHKQFFKATLQGYKSSKSYEKTIKQLEKVEARGRYKTQY